VKRGDLKAELRRLGVNDLQAKLNQFRNELFSLRLNASTAHVKDYSQFKKVRSNIALVQTLLKQAVSA
jgi:ribosomal protein L29